MTVYWLTLDFVIILLIADIATLQLYPSGLIYLIALIAF